MSSKRKSASDLLQIKQKNPSPEQVKKAHNKQLETHKDCPHICNLLQKAADLLILPRNSMFDDIFSDDNFEVYSYSKYSKEKNGKRYFKETIEERKQKNEQPTIITKYWACDIITGKKIANITKTEIKKILEENTIEIKSKKIKLK